MANLLTFIQVEISLILFFLALIIAYKFLTKQINTVGLLSNKETGKLSPARIQLLISTLVGACIYISAADVLKPVTELKSPDIMLLSLIGGSNIYYFGAKGLSRINEQWLKNINIPLKKKGG